MSAQSLPYGPNTAAVRRFLVRLAGLSAADRAGIVAAYDAALQDRTWSTAEHELGVTIERSGREAARDALAGPLLQLVQRPGAEATSEDDALDTLDPIAEPALAALLSLLVRDLLDPAHVHALYAPFAPHLPFDDIVHGT